MLKISTIVLFSSIQMIGIEAQAGPKVLEVCQTNVSGIEVRILKDREFIIEIHDNQTQRYYSAAIETAADYGGSSDRGSLSCDEVFSNYSMIAIRTGWNDDLAQIYAVDRKNNDVTLHQFRYLPHDSVISEINVVSGPNPTIRMRNGRKGDRYPEVCWDGKDFFYAVAPNNETPLNGWIGCNRKMPSGPHLKSVKLDQVSYPVNQ